MKKNIIFFCIFSLTFLSEVFPTEKNAFTLDEILILGIQNNPSLAARRQETQARKAAYDASKRLSNPELELHRGKGETYDGSETLTTDGLTLTQTLENPFKRHYRIQMSENDWQAVEYQYDSSRLDLEYSVKNLFYKILLLREKVELAQKNVESIQKIHLLIEKRARLGEVKELEAIKLQVEALKAQTEINRLQTELRLAKENLNKSLGTILPENFTLTGKLIYAPHALNDQDLVNKALLIHPLLKKKEKDVEFARNNTRYIQWQRFPDFSLSGFIENEIDGRNQGIGLSFELPLWDFKSNKIAEAEYLYLQQEEELRALKMEVATSVKTHLEKLRLDEQALKVFQEGLLKQAEESLSIAEISYKQGEISLIDYLDSQRTFSSIMIDYQESLYAWNTDQAALAQAIGEDTK